RAPGGADEEAEAELAKGRPRLDEERHQQAGEHHQHEQGEGEGDPEEEPVLDGEPAHTRGEPLAREDAGIRLGRGGNVRVARVRGVFSGGAHSSFLPHRGPWNRARPGGSRDPPGRTSAVAREAYLAAMTALPEPSLIAAQEASTFSITDEGIGT